MDNAMDHEVFDKAELLSRLEGDEEILAEMIGIFLAECGPMVQHVSDAATSQDAGGLERSAHKLKGSLSIFGSRAAMQSAQILETMGHDGDLCSAAEVLARLREQIAALEKALSDLREPKCPKS